MLYTSTRDNRVAVPSAQAIAQGLSREGGLFLPRQMPKVYLMELGTLAEMNYVDRAEYILSKFLTSEGLWERDEVLSCAQAAYTGTFRSKFIAPVKSLDNNTEILELFHGPTCAFKDLALQIMPRLLTAAAKKVMPEKELVILVATSGDTGKAALEGFRDVEGTKIVVFYPEQGVSPVQKRQMTTQTGKNVRVVAVRGNFDDTQNGVKAIFSDPGIRREAEARGQEFTSANSINWGRLVPQIVYYFSAYCDLMNKKRIKQGEKINFVVPTGNFGNILAGWYAKQMGLPIHKLICASNQNRVLADFFQSGQYDRNRPFHLTASPSMDILISSNLERLLYLTARQNNASITAEWMRQLSHAGRYEIPPLMHQALQKEFFGGSCNETQCAAAIRKAWETQDYLSDPHTAVALHVLDEYRAATGDATRSVVIATASPYKFAASVLDSLGVAVPEDEFAALAALEDLSKIPCPEPLRGLQKKRERFSDVCDTGEMAKWIQI